MFIKNALKIKEPIWKTSSLIKRKVTILLSCCLRTLYSFYEVTHEDWNKNEHDRWKFIYV
jgi:hypothetical protein